MYQWQLQYVMRSFPNQYHCGITDVAGSTTMTAVPKSAVSKHSHASLDHAAHPDHARLEAATDTFRMLSDRTRLHLLWLLSHGPADVTELTTRTDASRTAVSQHLAKLRFVGMVETQKWSTPSQTGTSPGWSVRDSTTPTTRSQANPRTADLCPVQRWW